MAKSKKKQARPQDTGTGQKRPLPPAGRQSRPSSQPYPARPGPPGRERNPVSAEHRAGLSGPPPRRAPSGQTQRQRPQPHEQRGQPERQRPQPKEQRAQPKEQRGKSKGAAKSRRTAQHPRSQPGREQMPARRGETDAFEPLGQPSPTQSKKRRKAKQARQRRRVRSRKRRAFFSKFLVAAVLLTAGFYAVTIFFKVHTVYMSGETRYPQEMLLEMLQVEEGDNLFFINTFAAKNRLRKQFTYLDTIKIKRHLPDAVELVVSDCIPAAAVRGVSGYYLIDEKGKVLEKVQAEKILGLPEIVGLQNYVFIHGGTIKKEMDERVAPLFQLIGELRERELLEYINYIDVDRLYQIRLGYNSQFEVNIGTLEKLDWKLKMLDFLTTGKQSDVTGDTQAARLSPSDTGIILLNPPTARFLPNETLAEKAVLSFKPIDSQSVGWNEFAWLVESIMEKGKE